MLPIQNLDVLLIFIVKKGWSNVMFNMRIKMIRRLLLSAAFALSSMHANATAPHEFFFFGDSLTDSGYQNNNPTLKQSGKTPLWTSPNGHTWAYYFLKDYARDVPKSKASLKPNNVDAATLFHPVPKHILPILDGNNFAAGGSTTKGPGLLNSPQYKAPSLLEQVDYFVHMYAPKHHVDVAKNTYFIWSGGNDIMKKLTIEVVIEHWLDKIHLNRVTAALNLFDIKKIRPRFRKTENQVAGDVFTAVNTLQQAGAKKIVVMLIPHLGNTPLMDTLAKGLQKEGSVITTTQLSAELNDVTQKTNALIHMRLAGTHAVIVDINKTLQPLVSMATPGRFQETQQQFGREQSFFIFNNQGAACPPKEQALTCIPTVAHAPHYVFEDLGHPTAQTHHIIGDYVYHQFQLAFSTTKRQGHYH